MKVYVVIGFEMDGFGYEFDRILGAFSSVDAAKKHIHNILDKYWKISLFEIHEVNVDDTDSFIGESIIQIKK